MRVFGTLAVALTITSWLGVMVLLRRSARLQINSERRLAEVQKHHELIINYLNVLKDEHHAAQRVIASWSPTDPPPSVATLEAALKDLAMTVAEVDAEEIRHLPEPPP